MGRRSHGADHGADRREDTITPHTRPPADDDAEHLLVRTVECLDGAVEVELLCEPLFDYGRRSRVDTRGSRSSCRRRNRGRTDAAPRTGSRPRNRGPASGPATSFGPVTRRTAPSLGQESPHRRTSTSEARIATTTLLARVARRARIPDHRYRDPIQRSALAIKGLTYMPTGATVAALTTSLPETPGGERNWDYRYTWMRDTTFTFQALHWLKLEWEADEFMQFVADVEPNEDGSLQIMYGIDGRRDLTESTLDELSGYAGARPVRIGNGAFDQRQNDVYGAVLDSILLRTRRPSGSHIDFGRSSGRRPSVPPRCGGTRIRASGRPAVIPSITCRRSSCAGSRRSCGKARGDSRRSGATGLLGHHRRADPSGHPRARRQRPGGPPRTRRDDALDASALLAAIFGFLPLGTNACATR